jgi:DNA repair protein RecN (Recombination protein N)
MLLALTIADFVLVDRLELALRPGFTVLTGETGAGKSILLDALSLVLGARADASIVREGADRAEIGAEFSIESLPELPRWLAEMGFEGDGDSLLLRRVVEAGGRSRAFINGRPATLQQLKEVGEQLVDIHGQHAHYSLMQVSAQRALLDNYGRCDGLAADVAAAYRAWQRAVRQRREAQARASVDEREREQLSWTVEELIALDFRADEWASLQEEHRRLAHAAELLSGAQGVADSLSQDAEGIIARLKAARLRLDELAAFDPRLASCAEMLEGGLIQAEETARELSRYADHLELDPDALAQAEARIGQVMGVTRKLRVAPEELPDVLRRARERLAELEGLADTAGLARREAETEQAYRGLAGELSARRREAAAALGQAVSEAMQQLAMKGGRMAVALAPRDAEAGGLETVDFQVSPHPGQAPRPLAKTASGGELSRLGLALQTVLAGQSGAGTLIFDEVDAGIGGGVAEIVGRLLADVGRSRQVLCVTHLPQVAARATQHWRVVKEVGEGRAVSRVQVLDGERRVEEIARMLGGLDISATTRQHAREMLAGNR